VGIGWRQAGLAGALAVLGAPVLAQDTPTYSQLAVEPAPRAISSEPTQVLPIWSSGSGRVEALLLIDTPFDAVPSGPLESLIGPHQPVQQSLGLRGRAPLGRNVGLNLDLNPATPPAMALLCDGNIALAVALGRLAEPCMLARLDVDGQVAGFGRPQNLGVSLDWHSDSGNLDLSFGLAWLEARDDRPAHSAFLTDPDHHALVALQPALLGAWQLHGQELSLQGQQWLSPRSWLRVDGRHGSTRLSGTFGLPVTWDSTSLRLSGGYRAFSGSVTGRLIEIDQPRQTWTDVDIALSWRTPWDARVSVGARNLLGGPDRERWPLATLPGMPESDARTPYVRYHQDL
jgi:hypothetical protein